MRYFLFLLLFGSMFRIVAAQDLPPEPLVRCPQVKIETETKIVKQEAVSTATAIFKRTPIDFKKKQLKLTWALWNGEIIAGQNTDKIEMRPENLSFGVSINLKIENLPVDCPNEFEAGAFLTTHLEGLESLDDYSEMPTADEKALLDNIFLALREEQFEIVILFQHPSSFSQKRINARLKMLFEHLTSVFKIRPSRLFFVMQQGEYVRTQFYRLQPEYISHFQKFHKNFYRAADFIRKFSPTKVRKKSPRRKLRRRNYGV